MFIYCYLLFNATLKTCIISYIAQFLFCFLHKQNVAFCDQGQEDNIIMLLFFGKEHEDNTTTNNNN